MVNYEPKNPGDDVCPQQSMIQSLPIKSGVSIRKGHIYTNGSGGLQEVTVSGGMADLTRPMFQAMADHLAPPSGDADGERKVQCIMSPTHIMMYAPAGIRPGQQVKLAAPTATSADTNKVEALGESERSRKTGYLGRVSEIYAHSSDGTVKEETADNDKIIVELARY